MDDDSVLKVAKKIAELTGFDKIYIFVGLVVLLALITVAYFVFKTIFENKTRREQNMIETKVKVRIKTISRLYRESKRIQLELGTSTKLKRRLAQFRSEVELGRIFLAEEIYKAYITLADYFVVVEIDYKRRDIQKETEIYEAVQKGYEVTK